MAMGEASRHPSVWSLVLSFDESEGHTDARVTAIRGEDELVGWGRARRNPTDPDVQRVGEDLAAARALVDLAHKLLEEAAHGIERFEGHHVEVFG
jgi:hypothetical protein